MKYNRLGEYGVPEGHEDRQTGKSLSLAFSYIGECLAYPGRTIRIRDHYSTRKSDRILLNKVCGILDKLSILFIDINFTNLTITYKLYQEVEAPERILSNGKIMHKEISSDKEFYEGHWYS